MIQREAFIASATRASNSAASEGVQPGFQNSASSEITGMPVMAESHAAGAAVHVSSSTTIADGLAVRVAIPLAVEAVNALTQRFELVSEAELEAAVRRYDAAGIRVEGAAAAPLALAQREELPRPLVLIVTGRNIDDARFHRILSAAP